MEGADERECQLWSQAIKEAVEFILPTLLKQQSANDRLKQKRAAMEEREEKRKQQLEALGNVGMKYTAQIMMTRATAK